MFGWYILLVPKLKELAAKVLLALGYSIRSKTKKVLIHRAWQGTSGSSISSSQEKKLLTHSKSQLGQDILALSAKGLDSPGYFVEFGAADGVALSNSYILEKPFGWKGILCEPSKSWQKALIQNRSCVIDTRCVYSVSETKISFSENYVGELSSITNFAQPNSSGILKRTTSSYEVETVSLVDLLRDHDAPRFIDFLSIDTEGSEFDILQSFDFNSYRFGVICVEHNYTDSRQKIRGLLLANGYRQVHEDLSDFDDWYVQALSK
jgi:FkbM family methyltransferase